MPKPGDPSEWRNRLRASSFKRSDEKKLYELKEKESNEKSKALLHPRIDFAGVEPKAVEAMMYLQNYVNNSTLPRGLLELVKTRASQLNGCAFCLDMHSKDARVAGESEQRIYLLDAWREAPFYSDRERAALEWTEAVTLVSKSNVPDEVFNEVRKYFTEKEIVELTMAIIAINGWNRLSISTRHVAGTYQPSAKSRV